MIPATARALSNLAVEIMKSGLYGAWGHGLCLDLAEAVLEQARTRGLEGGLLYIDNLPARYTWTFHAAAVVNGLVHCVEFPDLLPPAEYVRRYFGPDVGWEVTDPS